MSSERAHRPRILLVGPYERDNVGDLLFLLVTERYLTDADVVAAAPFASDMRELLGREVPAFTPLLSGERFDAIWSVGGQLGGVTVGRAYRMSASRGAYRAYRVAVRSGAGDPALRRAAGGPPPPWPYVPDPLDYPPNAGAIGVVNSAGLGSLKRLDPDERERRLALLRGQTVVRVRDRASSELLAAAGVDHRLAPDAVHALGAIFPVRRDGARDVAVFQASRSILTALDRREVAAALAACESLRGLRLRFVAAGTATGHDSLVEYERIARRLRRAAPWLDAQVVSERRPLALVELLARARVVVGTSLHIRVIASAYGVARVSLARPKVSAYAADWDPDMPYGVGLADLDAAIARALAVAERPESAAASRALSRRVHDELADLATEVLALARADTDATRARRAALRQRLRLGPAARAS